MLRKVEFAILDVETTGLFPERCDRVVEIAIVRADPTGKVIDQYTTLVNPERDIGPTHIHGLSARDVKNAPRFSEIAGDVISRVAGRVLVAHNASFDIRFLRAELTRAGHRIPDFPYLDTIHLARRADPAIPSRKLLALCSYFGIVHDAAHSALPDARATASLMALCFARLGGPATLSLAELGVRGQVVEEERWPHIPVSGRSCPRGAGVSAMEAPVSYISRLVARLPVTTETSERMDEYLALLDRVLEDRRVTPDEAEELESLSQEAGLSRGQVVSAHRAYMRDLLSVAWADEIITDAEQRDLEDVRRLLGIYFSEFEQLLQEVKHERTTTHAGQGRGVAGLPEINDKSICFTGMLRSRINGEVVSRATAERVAMEHGMVVRKGVVKKLDYLVVADPESMSGKANKAREYGVRILAEPVFWRMMGVNVE